MLFPNKKPSFVFSMNELKSASSQRRVLQRMESTDSLESHVEVSNKLKECELLYYLPFKPSCFWKLLFIKMRNRLVEDEKQLKMKNEIYWKDGIKIDKNQFVSYLYILHFLGNIGFIFFLQNNKRNEKIYMKLSIAPHTFQKPVLSTEIPESRKRGSSSNNSVLTSSSSSTFKKNSASLRGNRKSTEQIHEPSSNSTWNTSSSWRKAGSLRGSSKNNIEAESSSHSSYCELMSIKIVTNQNPQLYFRSISQTIEEFVRRWINATIVPYKMGRDTDKHTMLMQFSVQLNKFNVKEQNIDKQQSSLKVRKKSYEIYPADFYCVFFFVWGI